MGSQAYGRLSAERFGAGAAMELKPPTGSTARGGETPCDMRPDR